MKRYFVDHKEEKARDSVSNILSNAIINIHACNNSKKNKAQIIRSQS